MNENKPCKKTVTRRAKRPVPTIVLSLMCALAVIVSRSLTFPSAAQYRGLVFAYSDIFIVLASGIGGMGSGMLSFSLIFIAEFFRIDGNFSGLYTLSTYLILIIISARLAYDHFFCNIKKTVLSALFIAIALALCWHLTFSMLFPEVLPTDPTNPQMFRNLSLLQLIPGAFAETLFASILIYLFLHKAPDSLKCELGSGWQYTKAYEERHHLGKKRQYVLGVRVTALSIGEALLLCIVAILFSDIQVAVSQNSKFCILLIAKLWKSNLQLGLTMICAAFPISYLFNMYVLKYVVFPINEMSFILERYFDGDSRCQDGFPDLQIHSGDEIEKLYHSLKKMTADLVDYLQTQKEKHRLEAEVQAAQRASKAKSDFLSSMSHEIRTPINAVLGLDEMILRESDNSTVRNYANDIQSSGKMLLSIVNDILDLSKIEAGKMEIIPTEYDTDVLVHDLVNMIAGRAQSKGLEFIVTIDEKLPVHLFGDDTRIKQCILNILTNAVKYTPSGSVTFSLSCEKKDDNHIMLTAQVVDTGIGIKKEDLQKLYAPFERIEEKRNKSIEGTGLGMSIVKRLLAEMNSQLIVKSDYGHGSDFSFTVEQEVRGWEQIGAWQSRNQSTNTAYQESFQAPDARILVVDDTPMNLKVIQGLLKRTLVTVDTAPDAQTALAMAQHTPYHLIFIDHLMPHMNGIEMLHALRSDKSSTNNATTCIALTAKTGTGIKESYLQQGFADYVAKPVEGAQLELLLESLLPKSIVLHKGDRGFTEHDSVEKSGTTEKNTEESEFFYQLFGLHLKDGLRFCGDKTIFMENIHLFHEEIAQRAGDIENFAASKEWHNYTIAVHALKSASRLIGATELSEQARILESYGDKAQQNDSTAALDIIEHTPALLTALWAYKERLAPLCRERIPSSQIPVPAEDSRPTISQEKFNEACKAFKEMLSAFDFDSADILVKELDKYKMPPALYKTYTALCTKIREVDQAGAMELLES